jgi:hypothetical protein
MLVRTLVGRLAGQIVDLPVLEAQAALANGSAVKPDETPKVHGLKLTPEPKTAAEVIAMGQKGSGVPFLTFKSEAAKLLGDNIPGTKAAILKALEAL